MNPYIYAGVPLHVKAKIRNHRGARKLNLTSPNQYITDEICNYFGMTFDEINNQSRKREIVKVRQFILYWQSKLTDATLGRIGKIFTNKNYDHSDVIYAKNAYEDLLTDRIWKKDHEKIKAIFEQTISK